LAFRADHEICGLAEALEIAKGEEMVWLVEDKNTLLLCRTQEKLPRRLRAKPYSNSHSS
jgi:negative regulator of replication initiation